MARGNGKRKASCTAPARKSHLPTKSVAEDLVNRRSSTPGLQPATFENEDDIHVDDQQEAYYMRQEEEEEEEDLDVGKDELEDAEDEDSGRSSGSKTPPLRIIIPQKRKMQANLNKANKKKTTAPIQNEEEQEEELPETEEEEVNAPHIDYQILIFSLAELAKPKSRREPKARMLMLSGGMEWIDVYTMIKIKAVDVLFPGQDIIHDNALEITFTIPRIVKFPLPLSTAGDYKYLVKNASGMKTPTVNIVINQVTAHENPKGANKKNIPPPPVPVIENGAAVLKNTRKSKAPNVNDILPGNIAKNEKIKQLRARWECSQTTCHSEFCYVPADGPHFPLGHDHFDKWAAAMLHIHEGIPSATLEHPPNIREFDPVSRHTIVSRSPLLHACLKAMEKEKGPQAPGPIVNVVLPANYGLPLAAAPAPAPVADSGLIPSHYAEGQKMDLSAFCAIYELPNNVFNRLNENAITGTHAFAHMNSADLVAMGFKLGEIIDLKEVVKAWCTSVGCT